MWLELLRAEAEKTDKTATARKIGYSRTAVSLALSGNYKGKTDKLAATVLAKLGNRVTCPHLQKDIEMTVCRTNATGPMPMSNARKFRQWSACKSCPLNPERNDHDVD